MDYKLKPGDRLWATIARKKRFYRVETVYRDIAALRPDCEYLSFVSISIETLKSSSRQFYLLEEKE